MGACFETCVRVCVHLHYICECEMFVGAHTVNERND